VTEGYGILQPRVSVTMASALGSAFARTYAGYTGVDPYTTATSDIYQDLFDVALEAYENIQKVVVPGATEQDVFEACRVITDNGFKIHAPVLHGWSVGIHWPLVGLPGLEGWLTSEVVFEEGMCLMIEPNPITPDEKYGVFFGDVHVLEREGLRPLQKFPREFVVV